MSNAHVVGSDAFNAAMEAANNMVGVNSTATELNVLNTVVAGTAAAGKAAVLGASKNLDILALPVGGLKVGPAGSETATTMSGAELNLLAGLPGSVTITPAAGAANISLLTFQVKDAAGVNFTKPVLLDIWLSDATTGAGLTGTTASGAVAVGANGADFVDYVAKKAKRVQTDATGKYILSITDTAKTLFYPCAQLSGQNVFVGSRLIVGNYG